VQSLHAECEAESLGYVLESRALAEAGRNRRAKPARQ